MSDKGKGAPGPIVIKKYANRRLYNTQSSSYVTLDHLCQMVKDGVEFEVHDARTGEDITRQVLAQIIFDEENKGQHLLPIQFLRQLIGFYGDSLEKFVPSYLEISMENFTRNQQEMRDKFVNVLGGKFGYQEFEQLTRQNLQMFERAMRMFSPFGAPGGEAQNPFTAAWGGGSARTSAPPPEQKNERASPQRESEIDELKDQIAAMRQQIADLAQRK